jgi:hypothetical protein
LAALEFATQIVKMQVGARSRDRRPVDPSSHRAKGVCHHGRLAWRRLLR